MGTFSDSPALVAAGTIRPFRYVTISGRNRGVEANADGIAAGITDGDNSEFDTENHAIAEEPIRLQAGIVQKVEAGGIIVAGASLASDADGRAVTRAAEVNITGQALEPAGAAGDIIDTLFYVSITA